MDFEKYEKLIYKLDGKRDVCEVLQVILNRLVVRVKQPLKNGEVLIIQKNGKEFYTEVVSQNGCETVLWNICDS